jgi:hypothetical protein
MTPAEHEEIQELLAGHALHALDGDEAARVETLLASHVPSCPDCLSTLEGFELTAGDLALAAPSRRPPHILGARIRRETSPRRVALWVGRTAAAAAAGTVIGILAWNVLLTGRVSNAEQRQVRTTEVITTIAHPESKVIPLAADRPDAFVPEMTAVFVPGRGLFYVVGSLPAPQRGNVYQLWLERSGRYQDAGTFLPESGVVVLKVPAEPTRYDGLLITIEPSVGSLSPTGERGGAAQF